MIPPARSARPGHLPLLPSHSKHHQGRKSSRKGACIRTVICLAILGVVGYSGFTVFSLQSRSGVLPGTDSLKGRTLSEQQSEVHHGAVHYTAQGVEPAADAHHDELPHAPVHEASADIRHPGHEHHKQVHHEEGHIDVKHTEPASHTYGEQPEVHAPDVDVHDAHTDEHHAVHHTESESSHEQAAHTDPVHAPGEHGQQEEDVHQHDVQQPHSYHSQHHEQQQQQQQHHEIHRDISEPGQAKAHPVHAPDPVHTAQHSTQQHTDAHAAMNPPKEEHGFFGLAAKSIDGVDVPFRVYAGKVVLVVNVASACGYTDSNYRGLQKTYEKYKDHGLEILGFPCNQFGHQESGSESDIKSFCSDHYHVTFPMFSKIDVNGPNTSPVYQFLKTNLPASEGGGGGHSLGADIGWNFFKILVDHTGMPVRRFDMQWDAAKVEGAIYQLLAARNGIH